jgi:hypothetical protein
MLFSFRLICRFPIQYLALFLLASGCVSSGNPSVVDEGRTAQVILNTSTKEDVKRILDTPNSISRQSGSYVAIPGLPPSQSRTNVEVWSYSHMNVEVDGATFIPIVGLFAGGATSNLNTFTVIFDEQGIVRHISSTQSQGHSGLGASEKEERSFSHLYLYGPHMHTKFVRSHLAFL